MHARVLLALVLNFLWIGALGFGGGFGMIPLMKAAVLGNHWMSVGAFDQAIAMGQITPGPVAISAAFVGERVAGIAGAVVATIAVFAPSLVFVAWLTRVYARLKAVPGVVNVLVATLSAVVGLIAGITIVLGRVLVTTPLAVLVAACVAVLTLRWRIPYWAVILAAGVFGAVWMRP